MSSSKIIYLNKNDYFNNPLNTGYNSSYINPSSMPNIQTIVTSINTNLSNPSHPNTFTGHLNSPITSNGKMISSKNFIYVPSSSSSSSLAECEKGN